VKRKEDEENLFKKMKSGRKCKEEGYIFKPGRIWHFQVAPHTSPCLQGIGHGIHGWGQMGYLRRDKQNSGLFSVMGHWTPPFCFLRVMVFSFIGSLNGLNMQFSERRWV
jgi:hypothetical protein